MDLDVGLAGRRDVTGQIYARIRDAIVDGHLRAGDRLPPTRELAQRLEVSRTTVMVAYDRLTGEGFLRSTVGAGTFVSGDVPPPTPAPPAPGALRPRAQWSTVRLPSSGRVAPFDLRCGRPDAGLFPYAAWRRCTVAQLCADAVAPGRYGAPAGHHGLRAAIARHIGVARGVRATADDVVVTNGIQQGLDVVARAYLEPGDRVAVEDPGYPPARALLTSTGADVVSVPVDDEGIVVDAIPAGTRLVYVTPSHQFPLGVAMSLRRRVALLAWARERDAAVFEDDYDSEFRFGGRPIEPLQRLDVGGRVVYAGSFSKSMLPALRLGFVVVPPSLRTAVHAAKYVTDWGSAGPQQAALADFIDSGRFARHVRRMRGVYRERYELVGAALAGDLGRHLAPIPSVAGLHVSALTPGRSVDEVRAVVRRASADGVELYPTAPFAAAVPPPAGLVIGFGAIATADLREALRRLAAALDGDGPTAQ